MEKERSERTFEIEKVTVQTDYQPSQIGPGRFSLTGVEEVMYAERFVLITHRDKDGLMVRRTFPYEHLISITTIMKPDMPVLEGDDGDVQDEIGDKPYPASDALQALRDLGITVSEDR